VVAVTRLIIAYTPYHVLLATAGVAVRPGAKNHLIVINDFNSAAAIANALTDIDARPYESVSLCGGTFGVTSRARRQFRYRRALPEIAARTRAVAPQEIWVGNDARPESHAAFRAAGRGVHGIFVEDGLTAYARSVRRPVNALENAIGLIFFGRYWSGIEVLGTSGRVSIGLFIFPALVRPELSGLEKVPVPRECLLARPMGLLAERMTEHAGGDVARLRRVDAVVAVSHSSVAERSSDYRPSMTALVRKLLAQGLTVGIKYHPRQAERDYLALADLGPVTVLPQGLPLEYVFLLHAADGDPRTPPRSLRYVVGDVSTILLTARWLVPDACCISLARPLGMLDESLETLFTSLDVRLPRTLDGLT
jgi:hypothetical protein